MHNLLDDLTRPANGRLSPALYASPHSINSELADELEDHLVSLIRQVECAERRLATVAHAASSLTARLEQVLREQAMRLDAIRATQPDQPMVGESQCANESLATMLDLARDERRYLEQMMIDLRQERTRTNHARKSASAAAVRAVEASGRANRAGQRAHTRASRIGMRIETAVVVTPEARAWAENFPAGAD